MSEANKLRKLLTKNLVDIGQALVSLSVPGKVITDDISARWVDVGEGNILRMEAGADMYVAFSDLNTGGAVSVTTSPAVKLKGGEFHYVVCQCRYVRASANPLRIELLKA